MTKTYSFTSNNTNTSKFFLNSNPRTDYSEMLDDIITADIMDKNKYLFKSINTSYIGDEPIIITGSYLKADDSFIKATKFLANYKKNKSLYKIPFIIGKLYTLSDGTRVIFYDDEIQIGFDTYKYSDFENITFLNDLATTKKSAIINIFTGGIDNIKINIL